MNLNDYAALLTDLQDGAFREHGYLTEIREAVVWARSAVARPYHSAIVSAQALAWLLAEYERLNEKVAEHEEHGCGQI